MITLSKKAAQHIKQALSNRGQGIGIRLAVEKSGCSGWAYALSFVDQKEPGDQQFESLGVQLFIDPKSLVYLEGTQVDFRKEGLQEGFKFINPNARNECVCGKSFHV